MPLQHESDSRLSSPLLMLWALAGILCAAAACDLTSITGLPTPSDGQSQQDEQVLSYPPPSDDNTSDPAEGDNDTDTDEPTSDVSDVDPTGTGEPVDDSEPIDQAEHDETDGESDPTDDTGDTPSTGGGSVPPPPPPLFEAYLSVQGNDSIRIDWTDPDMAPNGFAVTRCDPQGNWLFRGNTDPDGRHYIDEQLTTNEVYCYQVVAYDMVGNHEKTEPVCEPLPPPLPHRATQPLIVTVQYEKELRDALIASYYQDVTVYVKGSYALGGHALSVPRSEHVLELIGVPDANGNNPIIDFQMHWDGNWDAYDPEESLANGISFYCASAFVSGITFTGFEWRGAVLKYSGSGLLHVRDCRFEKIKLTSWPTRTGEPALTNDDAWTGSIIVGASQAHMVVNSCVFYDCVQADAWGHCIYAADDCKTLTVTNCTFIRCGSVHRSQPEIMRCYGNTYMDSVQTVSSKLGGEKVWTFAYYPRFDNRVTVMFERFANATYRWPIRSTALRDRHTFEHNDYSGLRIENEADNHKTWKPYSPLGDGEYQPAMDFNDWQLAGFDQYSLPPHDF